MKVIELIKELEKLDPESTVVILDADTTWFLNIEYVSKKKDLVAIAGSYDDVIENRLGE